jgi:hypothetical protein
MRGLPPLVDATVVRQIPDQYRLMVCVDAFGGQVLFIGVDVLTHGPRDAVRGQYPPLPLPGTRGLVAFTRGDDRTGRWLGAQAPSLPDASTLAPGNGNTRYTAEWSGAWSWHGEDGTSVSAWPDGSKVIVGPPFGESGMPEVPVPTRHVVAPDGSRQRSPFTAVQRNPQTPSAFAMSIEHPSGAFVTIAPDGTVTVAAAAGKAVDVIGDLQVTGEVTAGYGTGDQVGLQTHKHGGVQTGGGSTSAPTAGT